MRQVPEYILAAGESQSAMFLTTYVNAVDLLAQVYDGFLIHSRFAGVRPLDGSSIFGPSSQTMPESPQFRSDLRVPLINVITETDLTGGPRLGYYLARQPDNERLRTWEAGSGNQDSVMASLFGSGELFDDSTLRRVYPGGATDYLARFKAALDTAIRSGFILMTDRQEILDLAAATYAANHKRARE